jgi:hypothetical protein
MVMDIREPLGFSLGKIFVAAETRAAADAVEGVMRVVHV